MVGTKEPHCDTETSTHRSKQTEVPAQKSNSRADQGGSVASKQRSCDTTLSNEDRSAVHENYPLKDVLKGKYDKRGRLILDVLWAVQDFKIFKTDKGISPHFSDNEEVAAGQRERYMELGQELSHLNHLIQILPPLRSWQRSSKSSGSDKESTHKNSNPISTYYEREMARGIAQALSGDAKMGKETLAALAKRLEKRLRNKGRVIYFSMCLLSALTIVLIASLFLVDNIGINWSHVAVAAIFGSVGALLSTAVGLRSLRIEADSTLVMNWIYGGQRMLVGVLGAIVLYLAVRAGVVLDLFPWVQGTQGTDATTELDAHKLAFMSILAGFSERLVPNLLARDTNDADDNQ